MVSLTILDTMIDLRISEKSLAILKENPEALGILKAYKPNRLIGYDEIEDNNGMFLYYAASSTLAIFLYRDVTRARAEELAVDFEHNLFVPYEAFSNSNPSQSKESVMEYIEEWRARDEASKPFRQKLNTILHFNCGLKQPEPEA